MFKKVALAATILLLGLALYALQRADDGLPTPPGRQTARPGSSDSEDEATSSPRAGEETPSPNGDGGRAGNGGEDLMESNMPAAPGRYVFEIVETQEGEPERRSQAVMIVGSAQSSGASSYVQTRTTEQANSRTVRQVVSGRPDGFYLLEEEGPEVTGGVCRYRSPFRVLAWPGPQNYSWRSEGVCESGQGAHYRLSGRIVGVGSLTVEGLAIGAVELQVKIQGGLPAPWAIDSRVWYSPARGLELLHEGTAQFEAGPSVKKVARLRSLEPD